MELEMPIEEVLFNVQQSLNAPKTQFNKFGDFYYRSCEDILTAIKPILKGMHAFLVLSDTIENIGGKNYVKATATLKVPGGGEMSCSAFARESEQRAKLDASQITGATSSYARKYALNGLLLIDDNKDPDDEKSGFGEGKEKPKGTFKDNKEEPKARNAARESAEEGNAGAEQERALSATISDLKEIKSKSGKTFWSILAGDIEFLTFSETAHKNAKFCFEEGEMARIVYTIGEYNGKRQYKIKKIDVASSQDIPV